MTLRGVACLLHRPNSVYIIKICNLIQKSVTNFGRCLKSLKPSISFCLLFSTPNLLCYKELLKEDFFKLAHKKSESYTAREQLTKLRNPWRELLHLYSIHTYIPSAPLRCSEIIIFQGKRNSCKCVYVWLIPAFSLS